MFDPLFKYIEQKSDLLLSQEERSLISEKFKFKKFRKKQYLAQEGDVCKQMAFMIKGAARMYSVDEKGHEHILRFGLEGWWLGDYESYMLEIPTRFHIEMLEATELLMVTKAHMQELIDRVPAVDQTIKVIDKQSAIATQHRIHAAISLTAEERYESLMNTNPAFLQRFPQIMIASYLGISAETLSQIKKKVIYR